MQHQTPQPPGLLYTIALAGNPNVGKSTVFNALTGMHQHTGNWPGKTVATAQGIYRHRGGSYALVDLPGTYSLLAHSEEEVVARDFILFGGADATIVVCDATCLERNLNLVLQVLEMTPRVVVCVNLLDEAKKKGITIDLAQLSRELGVPVVGTSARSGQGLPQLQAQVERLARGEVPQSPRAAAYPLRLTRLLEPLVQALEQVAAGRLSSTWAALRLLEGEEALTAQMGAYLGCDLGTHPPVRQALAAVREALDAAGLAPEQLKDLVVSSIVRTAETVAAPAVSQTGAPAAPGCRGCPLGGGGHPVPLAVPQAADARDRRLDRVLTSKRTGIPIMLALLGLIFWITITGANVPSQLLADGLFWVQDRLTQGFLWLGAPDWLHGVLVLGVYRVLAWVVSVMLPPMAIFFPLFTLLEDFGYLPRVAFNLDHQFQKAKACGKQALTMCMGFGCNAVGVTGCRIIDSPRERLIAILTNNFVPCNGRFPTLIAIISMFFVGAGGLWGSAASALILTGVILLGVLLTLWVSRLLSQTILRGEPSSFTLELPPYRTPQIGKVIVRSVFDRTLFVLGRAVAVAAPAGLLLWVLANVRLGELTLLAHASGLLDPFARLLGMDGVILLAFILGFPANEIVVPIIIMAYLSSGTLLELDSLTELRQLLVAHGWTWVTAVSTMLFCLVHWPCSTTCLTIRKETGSWKWTGVAIAIPTAIGMLICFAFTTVVRVLGLG